MAKPTRDDFLKDDLEELEWAADAADQAFWDEFWSLEDSGQGDTYTIIVKNERTGEEQKIENVRFAGKRKVARVRD